MPPVQRRIASVGRVEFLVIMVILVSLSLGTLPLGGPSPVIRSGIPSSPGPVSLTASSVTTGLSSPSVPVGSATASELPASPGTRTSAPLGQGAPALSLPPVPTAVSRSTPSSPSSLAFSGRGTPSSPSSGFEGPAATPSQGQAGSPVESPQTGSSTSPPVYEIGTLTATTATGSSPWGLAYDSGNGYVYVANYGSNNVSVLSGAKVVASIPVGTNPSGAGYDSANGYVYVTNAGSSTVSVISGTTVVATVPVGSAPKSAVYDGADGYVYVTNRGSYTVSVISGTSVIATIGNIGGAYDLAYDSQDGYIYAANSTWSGVSVISGTSVVATVPVGNQPVGVTYDSATGDIYVASAMTQTVSVIFGTSVVATVPLTAQPDGVGYASGNGDIYVADVSTNNVSVISGTSVVATVPVGSFPREVAYDAANGYVYVTNMVSNNVSIFSTLLQLGTLGGQLVHPVPTSLATVGVGNRPYALGYDNATGDVYVANQNTGNVSVISGTTVVATVPVGSSPSGVAYDAGNGEVYVVNSGSNDVSVISGTSVVATVTVGSSPIGAAYDSQNGYVYVANTGSNSVSVISGTSVLATVTVGTSPIGVGYDSQNGYVYVANYATGNVSVLSGTVLVATVAVGSGPTGVGYDSGNADIYVVDSVSDNVSVLSGTSTVGTVRVGLSPDGIGYDTGNGLVYVANSGSNNLSVLSGTSVVATVGVGSLPLAVGYDGGNGHVYVANGVSNSVSVLQTLWVPIAPPSLQSDAGQTLLLEAPLFSPNPGISTTLSSPLLPSGLSCTALPPSLNYVSMTCTATVPGTYSVTLTAVGTSGNSAWSRNTVTVFSAPSVTSPTPTRGSADVGQQVAFSTTAAGGPGTYRYYSWSAPNALECTASTSNTIACLPTGAGSGTVSVNVTDANNATSSTATVSYSVSADPTVTTPVATRMNLDVGQSTGLSFTATNGTGLWSILAWSGLPPGCAGVNDSSLTCSPSASGTYSVAASITDSNGMTVRSGTVTLTVSPALATPTFTVSRTTLDVGQSVLLSATVSGGTGSYTYTWGTLPTGCATSNTAALTCSPASVGSGAFATTVTVTDGNGVSLTSATVTLTVSADPTLSTPTAPRTNLDVGQSTNLSASATNGTGLPATYTWAGLPTGCVGTSSLAISCAPTVTGSFSVTITLQDSNGFRLVSSPLTLTVSPALGIAGLASSRSTLDVGQSVSLVASVRGGTGIYAYSWNGLPSGCVGGNAASLSCSPSVPGTFGVQVWINDTNGGSATTAQTLIVSADPTVTTPTGTSMNLDLGQSTVLSFGATNGTGGWSILAWSGLPSGCASVNASSLNCRPSASGTFSVSASITDSNGMSVSSGTVILTVSPTLTAPILTASRTTLDVGQSVVVTANVLGGSGPYSYTWSGLPQGCASGNSATLTCTPLASGSANVTVTVKDSNGVALASSSLQLTVSSRLIPGSIALDPAVLDLGQSTKLTVSVSGGSGGLSYAWSGLPPGCGTSGSVSLACTPSASGTSWVTVVVTDPNGETVLVGPVSLVVAPTLGTASVSASVSSLTIGSTVAFTAVVTGGTAPYSYTWSGLPTGCAPVNAPTLTCTPTAQGTYSVSVKITDSAGASVTSSAQTVTVSRAPTPAATGLSNGLDWGILALAVIGLVVGLIGLFLALRKRGPGDPDISATTTKSTHPEEGSAGPPSSTDSPGLT